MIAPLLVYQRLITVSIKSGQVQVRWQRLAPVVLLPFFIDLVKEFPQTEGWTLKYSKKPWPRVGSPG